jgi:hypothetical protein
MPSDTLKQTAHKGLPVPHSPPAARRPPCTHTASRASAGADAGARTQGLELRLSHRTYLLRARAASPETAHKDLRAWISAFDALPERARAAAPARRAASLRAGVLPGGEGPAPPQPQPGEASPGGARHQSAARPGCLAASRTSFVPSLSGAGAGAGAGTGPGADAGADAVVVAHTTLRPWGGLGRGASAAGGSAGSSGSSGDGGDGGRGKSNSGGSGAQNPGAGAAGRGGGAGGGQDAAPPPPPPARADSAKPGGGGAAEGAAAAPQSEAPQGRNGSNIDISQ